MIEVTAVQNHPMSAKAITTQDAPAPVGPYNQAVLAGPSGRVGLGSGQVLALAPDASAVIIDDGTTSRLFTVNDSDATGGAPIDVVADLFTFVVDSTIDPVESDPDTNTADSTDN